MRREVATRATDVQGSINDVAKQKSGGLQQAMAEAEVVVLVDISGSMADYDGTDKARYERAQEVLDQLQRDYAGKIILASFDYDAEFQFTGRLPLPRGGTNLAGALNFVRDLSEAYQIILVTDGRPDSPQEALESAKRLASPLNIMFVGAENDVYARDFLDELAKATGGSLSVTKPELIGGGIKGYLHG